MRFRRYLILPVILALASCATITNSPPASPPSAVAQLPEVHFPPAPPKIVVDNPFEGPTADLEPLPAATGDLWDRIVRGYAIPDIQGPLVDKWEHWYAARPDYVARMVERTRPFFEAARSLPAMVPLRLRLELTGYEHTFRQLEVKVIGDEVVGPQEAKRYLGPEIADALAGVDIPVLVKNPVNPDVELWLGAIERLNKAGIQRIAAVSNWLVPFMAIGYVAAALIVLVVHADRIPEAFALINETYRHLYSVVELSDAQVRFNLGLAYVESNKDFEAKRTFSEVLKIDPNYWDAYYQLGLIQNKKGDKPGARSLLENLLAKNPNYEKKDEVKSLLAKL
mgnify:CR=1 FL=1